MIQCKDCEFFKIDKDGRRVFMCDPDTNIKEPACIAKWQLVRLDELVVMRRKILAYVRYGNIDEADYWKTN